MQLEAAGIGVDGGVLGLVGVVDHAVLAVGHEGVDFHIVVGGEPLVQDLFTVGSPQDGAVQNAAVLEGIGQAGNVDAAALAESVCRHLDFLVTLHQNVGAFVGLDALLALAEVHFTGYVCQDEMVGIGVPIILVVVQGEAGFLLHAQHLGQLEEVTLILVAGGLADADEAAAVVDKFPNGGGNGCILPLSATGVNM